MMTTDWRPPRIPREHGAWVMLAIPLILGVVLTGPRPCVAWWIAPAAVFVFLAHESLVPVAQRRLAERPCPLKWTRSRLVWGGLYLGASAGALALAVLGAPVGSRSTLLALAGAAGFAGAVYAVASVFGHRRDLWVELVGMGALALSAPMMAAAAGTWHHVRPLAAAALAFAYFVSALAFVRSYDRRLRNLRKAVTGCLVVHAGLVAGLVGLWLAGVLPALGLLAFAPVLGRTVWGIVRPPAGVVGLGFREAWVAGGFTMLALVALIV